MKKLTASLLVAFAALSSTAAFADTPAVREMNTYSHILTVANKNRMQAANPSEFVIYHQDAAKPCKHKDKKAARKAAKTAHKKAGHHAHHHKKADKPAERAKKAHKVKTDMQKKTDDNTTSTTK